jgi:hypothetical protein
MIHERWAVQLVPDRGIPYRITPYSDYRDFGHFASFVATYHQIASRRRFA